MTDRICARNGRGVVPRMVPWLIAALLALAPPPSSASPASPGKADAEAAATQAAHPELFTLAADLLGSLQSFDGGLSGPSVLVPAGSREDFLAYLHEQQVEGPAAARSAAVSRIDRALGVSELADVLLGMRLARATEMSSVESVLEQRPDLRRRAARVSALWLLHYAHRERSTAELVAYAAFLDSPVGRWKLAAIRGALQPVLEPHEAAAAGEE